MTASRVLSGTAASDGIAIGPAHLLVPPVIVVERQISRDLVPVEVARLISAVTSTDERLAVLSARLESEHLHEGHLLLEAHRMMLRDDEIVGGTRRLIESDEIAAEWAVRRVIDAIAATCGHRGHRRPSAAHAARFTGSVDRHLVRSRHDRSRFHTVSDRCLAPAPVRHGRFRGRARWQDIAR